MTTFKSFGLPSFILESLERIGITEPTPIQEKSIPTGLEGNDILGSAQTGTGKTMAFLIPLLTNLTKTARSTALVMAPTRELAAQIQDAAQKLVGKKLHTVLLIGGESMYKQLSALKRQPRLIIGTPGRINDHLTRGTLRLNETRFLVLDETDRMLDMGFSEALKKIAGHLPQERQTFMFSATMPPSIKTLSMTYLTNPQLISIGSTTQPVLKIKQEVLHTATSDKFSSLIKELNEREGSIIIFVKTKHGADRLADKLSRQNHHATAIHGDLKQRKREEAIKEFRNLVKRIMVATDVAARGLDISHIKHVINYDLPQCPEDYIHRIGRTGRAGMEGNALSFVSPEEGGKWRRIHTLIETGKDDPSLTSSSKSQRKRDPRPFSGPSKRSDSKREGFRSEGKREGFRPEGKREGFRPEGKREGFQSEGKREGFRSEGKREGFRSEGKREGFRSEGKREGFRLEGKREGFRSEGKREGFRSEGKREGFRSEGSKGPQKSFSNRPTKNGEARPDRSKPAPFKKSAPKRDGAKRPSSQARSWA